MCVCINKVMQGNFCMACREPYIWLPRSVNPGEFVLRYNQSMIDIGFTCICPDLSLTALQR